MSMRTSSDRKWVSTRGITRCSYAGGDEVSKSTSCFFFFQAEDGIRDYKVTGVQTCALPIPAVAAAAEPGPHRQRLRAVPRTDRAGPRPGAQRDGDLAGSRRRSRLPRSVRDRKSVV